MEVRLYTPKKTMSGYQAIDFKYSVFYLSFFIINPSPDTTREGTCLSFPARGDRSVAIVTLSQHNR